MCSLRSSRRSSVQTSLAMTAMLASVDKKLQQVARESGKFPVSARDEAVDRAVERGDVEAVLVVFAEGAGVGDAQAELAVLASAFQVGGERAQPPLAEV